MSKVFIEEQSLTAIGDAIRRKTGDEGKLSVPSGMVNAIDSITAGEGGGGDVSINNGTLRTVKANREVNKGDLVAYTPAELSWRCGISNQNIGVNNLGFDMPNAQSTLGIKTNLADQRYKEVVPLIDNYYLMSNSTTVSGVKQYFLYRITENGQGHLVKEVYTLMYVMSQYQQTMVVGTDEVDGKFYVFQLGGSSGGSSTKHYIGVYEFDPVTAEFTETMKVVSPTDDITDACNFKLLKKEYSWGKRYYIVGYTLYQGYNREICIQLEYQYDKGDPDFAYGWIKSSVKGDFQTRSLTPSMIHSIEWLNQDNNQFRIITDNGIVDLQWGYRSGNYVLDELGYAFLEMPSAPIYLGDDTFMSAQSDGFRIFKMNPEVTNGGNRFVDLGFYEYGYEGEDAKFQWGYINQSFPIDGNAALVIRGGQAMTITYKDGQVIKSARKSIRGLIGKTSIDLYAIASRIRIFGKVTDNLYYAFLVYNTNAFVPIFINADASGVHDAYIAQDIVKAYDYNEDSGQMEELFKLPTSSSGYMLNQLYTSFCLGISSCVSYNGDYFLMTFSGNSSTSSSSTSSNWYKILLHIDKDVVGDVLSGVPALVNEHIPAGQTGQAYVIE